MVGILNVVSVVFGVWLIVNAINLSLQRDFFLSFVDVTIGTLLILAGLGCLNNVHW